MRKLLIMCWLLVPVGVAAYHFGPGQDRLLLDDAGGKIREAESLAASELWEPAIEAFDEALALLPDDRLDPIRRVRLEKAKAQMMASQLPDARASLETLLGEIADDPGQDADLEADVREALANSQYYMTWLLRLEGHPREVWEPEIESSRQNYRLLAERSQSAGLETDAKVQRENLESAIRLARLDLAELQGLPLPSQ